MRIAFHLNCLEQGGAERVVSNLANQFAKEGNEVFVATEWYGEDEYVLDEAVHRVHVGISSEDEGKNRLYLYNKRVKNLRQFIKREELDVLIAFAQSANYRSLKAAHGTGCPVCVCVRSNPYKNYSSWKSQLQIKALFPRATGFVFQTEMQRDFFPEYVRKKSTVILNPIHSKYIDEPISVERRKVVVHSGRLVDFKNQDVLIDAFEMVHQKHPDYVLEIYGPDSFDGTKELLEAKIKEYNAYNYVKLMGGSNQLEKDLKDGAVYAFSSEEEGMPNALMEAMALKLPVVATDCPCGGPATIIQDKKNGMLVPIKQPQKLADAICYMIEHPQEAEQMAIEAGKLGEIANAQAVYTQWKSYIDRMCRKQED